MKVSALEIARLGLDKSYFCRSAVLATAETHQVFPLSERMPESNHIKKSVLPISFLILGVNIFIILDLQVFR